MGQRCCTPCCTRCCRMLCSESPRPVHSWVGSGRFRRRTTDEKYRKPGPLEPSCTELSAAGLNTPAVSRTRNLRIRSPLLYPVELRALVVVGLFRILMAGGNTGELRTALASLRCPSCFSEVYHCGLYSVSHTLVRAVDLSRRRSVAR
jgi:hypothetical protein